MNLDVIHKGRKVQLNTDRSEGAYFYGDLIGIRTVLFVEVRGKRIMVDNLKPRNRSFFEREYKNLIDAAQERQSALQVEMWHREWAERRRLQRLLQPEHAWARLGIAEEHK